MSSIPLKAHILMLGLVPSQFSVFQSVIKTTFDETRRGWNFVASHSESFEHATKLIALRHGLDAVFIANYAGRTEAEMREGAKFMRSSIVRHPNNVWVLLNRLEYLAPVFEAVGGIVMVDTAICDAMSVRHDELTEALQVA